MTAIRYRIGNDLDIDALLDLYRESTLGARRPVDDRSAFESMIRHANLVVTAWDGDLPVGISRSFTDFAYVAYLADLAVRVSHQKCGIGRELIRRTREHMGPRSKIVLLSAPAAVGYYPKLGFARHSDCFLLSADQPLVG